jgi:hypothetical protein
MPTNLVSMRPYLDYGIPDDLKKIQAKVNAAKKAALLAGGVRSSAGSLTQIATGIRTPPGKPDLGAATLNPSTLDRSELEQSTLAAHATLSGRGGGAFATRKIAESQPAGAKSTPTAHSAAALPTVMVTPNGVVPVGFNCTKGFEATATEPSFDPDYISFRMLLKNKGTGFDQIFSMGIYNTGGEDFFPVTVQFEHYFGIYNTMAYKSAAKTAIFVVECQYYDSGYNLPIQVAQSAPVTLDFSGPSCLGIQSMAVSADTFVGGDNDKEPTLTVTLDGPAGPGGQTVALATSKPNLARIMGTGSFVIPAGQTSGAISWFLGTREVSTTGRSFHIEAELVSPGGHSPKGVVEIWLNKKKKKW